MGRFLRQYGKWGILILVLLIAGGWRFWLLTRSSAFLLTRLLPDDAYYYFQLGKQAAHGLGSTFDGIHLTNGYHPLWMWINTLAFYLVKGDREVPIRTLLALTGVLDLIIGGMVFVFLRRMRLSWGWSLLGMVIYLFNPWSIANSLNGMESTLANALLCTSILCAYQFLTSNHRSRWWLMVLSLTAVGTILSRIDYALLIGLLGLGVFIRDERRWPRHWYMCAFLPGGALLLAWSLYWIPLFGTLIPQSGFAFSEVNRTLFFYKDRSMFTVACWCVYQWFRSIRLAAQSSGVGWGVWLVVILFLAQVLKNYWRRWRDLPAAEYLLLIMVIAFGSYTFLQGAIRWSGRDWYFTFGTILFSLCLTPLLATRVIRLRNARVILGTVLLLIGCSFLWSNPLRMPRYIHQQEIFDASQVLRDELPTSTRIGMFNAGVLGYYAPHIIVNLDGVVNTSAYQALHAHRLKEYLRQEKVEYIVDYEIAVNYRYAPFWGETDPAAFLQVVKPLSAASAYHGSRLMLYHVIP